MASFLRNSVYLLAAGLVGFIIVRLVQMLRPLTDPLPWLTMTYWAASAVAVGALGWTIITRANERTIARRVDEGADLRESLSTALCFANTDDPWAKATIESAVQQARGVNVKQAVPIPPPKFWPVPLALALSLLVVWLAVTPRQTEASREITKEKANIVAASSEADKVKAIEEKVASLEPKKIDEPGAEASPEAPQAKTPEEISLQAIKKLSSVMDRLEELKQGEQAKTAESMNEMLKQLKQPGPGPLAEMSKELSKGNFAKAAQQLAEQMKKAQMGEMSEQEKKQLAEQLAKLAEQLNKAGNDRKQAEKELEKAGLNKELAKDPQKLAEALKNAKNLTEEQKKQLETMCKACNNAGNSASQMAKAMSQMAQSMNQNGKMDPNAMNALQDLAQQLGEMDKMSSQMNQADSAMAEAKAQMEALAKLCESNCNGMGECEGGSGEGKIGSWKSGWSEQAGTGSGGPGRGQGSRRDEAKADFTMKIEKQKSKTQAGPVIASEILEAEEQQRGESTQTADTAVALAEQNMSEALENNQIPREFHDAVKHYFGRLKSKTKAGSGAAASENAASSEKPAESKESSGDKK